MKKIKIGRSTKQYIMVAIICIVVIGGASIIAFFFTTNKMKEDFETKLYVANQKITENERMVYVATDIIPAGGILTTENTKYEKVLSSQPQESFIDSNDLGKKTLVEISIGMQITKSNVTEADITSDLRETNFSVILNSRNIINNDIVDVRILFPNGENKVVLSKKNILDMTEGNPECFFWLSEEEILRMSAAIVDAADYEGALLYTVEYIEPSLQDASIVTYTPSEDIIEEIKKNPNIVKIASEYLSVIVREQLEKRLKAYEENEDVGQDTSSNKKVISKNYVQESQIEYGNNNDTTTTYQGNNNQRDTNSTGTVEDSYFYPENIGGKDLG